MKPGARGQSKGTIRDTTEGAANGSVTLDIGGGAPATIFVWKQSGEPGLTPGGDACAVMKAAKVGGIG